MRELNEDDMERIRKALRDNEVAFLPEHIPPDSFPEEIPDPNFWDRMRLEEISTRRCRCTLFDPDEVLNEPYHPEEDGFLDMRGLGPEEEVEDPVFHIKWKNKRRKT